MSEVWITNPTLTPEHDVKVLEAALGMYGAQGWQVRPDQSDTSAPPTGGDGERDVAAGPVAQVHEQADATGTEPPAPEPADTTKKGKA